MAKLVPVLATQFANVFPELQTQVSFVSKVVEEEELSFLRTLELGLKRLDNVFLNTPSGGKGAIAGEVVFELSDTFGFPSDLTALIAREKGFSIDEEGFQKALQIQKERSRKDSTKEATDWVELAESDGVVFEGYELHECEATIVKYRKVKTKSGNEYHIVLDRTPFYAEMGGQVGDTGTLTPITPSGGLGAINIVDTKKENDLFIHISRDKDIDTLLQEATTVMARIDSQRRGRITQNHTATHLMLAAMRQVLGNHISQKGSYQNDEVTRFDFSHFSKVTDEELGKIEDIVNAKIRENIALDEKRNVPIAEAIAFGATATFGEKYGDFVRVITYGSDFSVELCGGTHVPATGEIGLFKFVSESSVSAGVRRVEAYTGEKALELFNEQQAIINELKDIFKGQDVVKAVKALIDEKNALIKKVEALENEKLQETKTRLLNKIQAVGNVNMIVAEVEVPNADGLKNLAFQLRQQVGDLYCVLGAVVGGKPQLAVMIADNLVAERQLNAGQLIREFAKEIKGGGGGQPFFATAGGNDATGLSKALEKAKGILNT